MEFAWTGCDMDTRMALSVGDLLLFYRDNLLSFEGDPVAFSGPVIGDSPALFLLSTGAGIGAPSGKCNVQSAAHADEQGCCSDHGGISPGQMHYPGGPVTCADFSVSRTCTWKQ
ncbi:MAG: hypothetical protein ACYDCL_21215 [Myxococcales bacterium]